MDIDLVKNVLSRFGVGPPLAVAPAEGGKVHETVFVDTAQGRFVLQRLHPPFNHETALDAHAVTSHLARHGLPVPAFLVTAEADPFVRHRDAVYRLMTHMPGVLRRSMESARMAWEAGRLAGRTHAAMSRLAYTPCFVLEGFHDPLFLMGRLHESARRLPEKAKPLLPMIRRFDRELPKYLLPGDLPKHLVHGDLKLANFLWSQAGTPSALLDFDSFSLGQYPVEMADAFRSWCGVVENDAPQGFRVDLLDAAWRGYRETAPPWSSSETEAMVSAIPLLFLELGIRYATDAIEESYFAWDPSRFPTRAEHNRARARTQWELFVDVRSKARLLADIFGSAG